MAAHILKMNNADTIKFLQLYKNEAVLWDANHENYRNREIRNAALKRIAEIMDIEGFTDIHVPMKFRNLRSSYSQELKKIAASNKQTGSFPGNVYKPKVIWFSLMNSFLKPHVKTRKTVTDLITISDDDASRSSDENSMIVVNKVKSELISLPKNTLPEPSATLKDAFKRIIPETLLRVSGDNPGLNTCTKMRRFSYDDHEFDEAEASFTVKKSEQIDKRSGSGSISDSRENSLDCFAQYIVSLLKNLPNPKSIALQSKIISLILTDSYLDSNSENRNHISEQFIEDLNDAQSEDFEYKDLDII